MEASAVSCLPECALLVLMWLVEALWYVHAGVTNAEAAIANTVLRLPSRP
jgi:hypothetical protein